MSLLTPVTSTFAGAAQAFQAASSGGDSFLNDGKTMLLFSNTNAAARTVTIPANNITKQGIGTVQIPATTIVVPNSTTNGGQYVAGPFPQDRFSNNNGQINLSYDNATGLSVAVVKIGQYV